MTAYHPFRSEEAKERYLNVYDRWAEQWPVASEPRMVDTSYGQTFVRISGPADAAPLVLLPGATGTSLMWIPNIAALSEHHKTYAVDNIYDYGRSVCTRTFHGADDFVHWLDDLFSALELGDAIGLIGMSYGGWLASQYALTVPSRLHKLVLLAPAATVLPVRLEVILRALPLSLPLRSFTRNFMYWVFEDSLKNDEANRLLLEAAIDHMFIASRCFKPKRWIKPTVLTDRELQTITVPALYLVGEKEKIYSAQRAVQRLNRVAPHVKTEIIPNAGHVLTAERPQLVNGRILTFLKR